MAELKSILLAEDNPKDVELTLTALAENRLANEVVVASDGEEALDYLFRRGRFALRAQGNPAVVLLDLKMPKVDGLEVLRRVKADQALKTVPVVMLTSSREAPGGQETTAMTADGREVPIEISGSLVEIGSERLVLAIVRDVSERKQLEEQFRQAQKMEAVGRLAGGVAHDFNNLLTVILGYSDVVNNQLPPEHPLRPEVEQIRKAGERAATLTRQLLAFSRTQVLLPQLINVREIVTDIDKMLGRVIGEDIDLLMACDRETGRVKADRGQLEQVLMNLAVNARDAMPSGGRLTIETRNVELGEADAQNAAAQPGPTC